MPPYDYQQPSPQPPPPTPSFTSKNSSGKSTMVVSVVVVVLLVASLGFGVWAYMNYQKASNNTEEIAAQKVETSLKEQKATLESEFQAERDRVENTFAGPEVFGQATFKYPRDWSTYIDYSGSPSDTFEAYIHPGAVKSSATATALRLKIDNASFDKVLSSYKSRVEDGELKSRSIIISGQQGVRLDGKISGELTGSIVLLPLRDKTLAFWTESSDFMAIFNESLKTLTYIP